MLEWNFTARQSKEKSRRGASECSAVRRTYRRGKKAAREASNYTGISRRRLHKHSVSGTKGRWLMATSDKSPSPEQTRDHPSFQDGVDTDCKGADTSGGVVTETGPERCVSQRPSLSGTSRVSEVPMARTDLEVPGPSLWSKQCPAHVYQTHEADSGLIEEVGTQDRHVPRR